MQHKRIWLCAALFLILPALSFAGGPVCSTATAVIPDGRSLELDYVAANGTAWYEFGATANHSYSVEVRDDLDQDNPDFNPPPVGAGNVLLYGAPVNCSSLPSPLVTTDTHSIEPAAGPHAVRFSFVASTTGAHYIYVLNGGGSGHYVTVTVAETTLYSPVFNNYSSFTMYYTLANTTSASFSYTMTVYDNTGTPKGSSGLTPLSAYSSTYLSSTSGFLATNPAIYGTVILTHNGPPGAIQVEASTVWVVDATHTLMRSLPFAAIRQLR